MRIATDHRIIRKQGACPALQTTFKKGHEKRPVMQRHVCDTKNLVYQNLVLEEEMLEQGGFNSLFLRRGSLSARLLRYSNIKSHEWYCTVTGQPLE